MSKKLLIAVALLSAAAVTALVVAVFSLRGGGTASAAATPVTLTINHPANGAVVSGSILWDVVASSPPYRIDFSIDGAQSSWTEHTYPYYYNGDPNGRLDTTTLANGMHTLTNTAYDQSGNPIGQTEVSIDVENPVAAPPPPTPPTAYSCPQNIAGYTYDACTQTAAYILTGFLKYIQATSQYTTWAKANPAEVTQLKAYLVDTATWTSTLPQRFPMKTAFGSVLQNAITICKVVGCGSPPWPAAPLAGSVPDTIPPTAPTGLQVIG